MIIKTSDRNNDDYVVSCMHYATYSKKKENNRNMFFTFLATTRSIIKIERPCYASHLSSVCYVA